MYGMENQTNAGAILGNGSIVDEQIRAKQAAEARSRLSHSPLAQFHQRLVEIAQRVETATGVVDGVADRLFGQAIVGSGGATSDSAMNAMPPLMEIIGRSIERIEMSLAGLEQASKRVSEIA